MAKIPFKVSARTARLIGSQNFSNAEGAIVELVKNCYDADAKRCIVLFDNVYAGIPEYLSMEDYELLNGKDSPLSTCYKSNKKHGRYNLDPDISDTLQEQLSEYLRSKSAIYIIDDGDGMTDKIIENHWMVIGTDNKQNSYRSDKGRIRTGAKGIGRFALDRLGDFARMTTVPKDNADKGFVWKINWSDFDKEAKNINDVKADLLAKKLSYGQEVKKIMAKLRRNMSKMSNFRHGTIIEIRDLHDIWDESSVSNIYSALEVLVPPQEESNFRMFLFGTKRPDKYGEILPATCDDYDWKLEAEVDDDAIVKIRILRNEYDLSNIPKVFFNRKEMQKKPFSYSTFTKRGYSYQLTLNELLPGYVENSTKQVLDDIGTFKFIFYFMKSQMPNKSDEERFYYKRFDGDIRKNWLANFAGIKLFRDNFRIRPYGETKSATFDWLDLGGRVAASPAGIAKKSGGYRIRPNNITGIIHISRLININFEDKSSREGLQENQGFLKFKQVLLSIISEFERQRSLIARELDAFYVETHEEEVTAEQAENIAEKVRRKSKRHRQSDKGQDQKEKEVLATYISQQNEEIEELKSEHKLLAVLASNAITIASFAHELRSIEKNLVNRVDEVKKYLINMLDAKMLSKVPDYKNPVVMLKWIRANDIKLKEWLNYALGTLRKDKRRRKNINLVNYFKRYGKSWKNVFDDRGIKFHFNYNCDRTHLKFRVFEVDLDCIFNNLVTNSITAFQRKDAPGRRNIQIDICVKKADIICKYKDSGPGLSKDITEPERIFEPHFTTRKDRQTGEDIGTGLGMWLVKSFVEDNNGQVSLLKSKSGFGLEMVFKDKIKK